MAGTAFAIPGIIAETVNESVQKLVCKEPCEIRCPENSSWRAGNFCDDSCYLTAEDCTNTFSCGCYCNKGFKKVNKNCVPESKCCDKSAP